MRVLLGLVPALAALAADLPAQAAATDLVRQLAGRDRVEREVARRRLALAKTLPVTAVAELLEHTDGAVVAAAARLLRDRGRALDRLRALGLAEDVAVRRAVLPVAADRIAVKTLEEAESGALRRAALFELEDRGKLTDALLLAAIRGKDEELADAAVRLIVFERAPFPLALADELLGDKRSRTRLITWLADRPRSRSGPWLMRVLRTKKLTDRERLLAIQSLPPDWIDLKLAREVLGLAGAHAVQAARAAARFPSKLADRLVPDVVAAADGKQASQELLAVLDRVSAAGERDLFERALKAGSRLRHEVSHWLTSRESKLVPKFLAELLDARAELPAELVSLTGPLLTTPARVRKVVRILEEDERYAAAAFSALVEAGVYHPAMVRYAADGAAMDKARRYWRLLRLPLAKLPEKLFTTLLRGDDADACIYAVNSLARARLGKTMEPLVLELALHSELPTLRTAACRAILLRGSERAGRRVWALRKGEPLALKWLLADPKPWSHDILLQQRAAMTDAKKRHAAEYHRVLIALAELRDRGASEELLAEIPFVRPLEMQRVQKLLGRQFKPPQLQKLAERFMQVRPLKKGAELKIDHSEADEGRAALLEWFIRRKELDLDDLLTALWERDESYEIRLVALRGLLARGSRTLHAKLLGMLAKPFGEEQQELAFEVVGSMAHPLTARSLELLAEILLRAPLRDPRQEIRLALTQSYDSVRGAYPLITPATNLLRRDDRVRPGAAFAAVAAKIGPLRYALNRQRLGLILAGISRREELVADLGPVIARLILAAPDPAPEFVGPAQMILAEAAESAGDHATAARLAAAATRAFCRGVVPDAIRRSFLGTMDVRAGYHPLAALAATAPLNRARLAAGRGDLAAARRELVRALDLAEGDARTIAEITTLRRALQK